MVKIEKTRLPAILTDLLFFIMIIIHCRVFGSDTEKKQDIDTNSFRMHFVDTFCAHSKEAKDSGLIKFLAKVRKEYYEQHPFLISTLPNVTREIIRAIYQPYDASPTALKKRTDSSRTLSKQLNNLKITKSKLKIRERRILAQTKYLLQHNFDFPLEDYYSGIWLLGPDYLCESTTCDILTHFRGVLIRFLPRTVEDLELVKHWILKHNSTFNQLEENGRSGVKYGMVQPMEVCRASVDALKSYNSGIGDKGPEGVWDEPIGNIVLSEDFYEDLEDDVVTKWQAKYDNQYPSETLKKALLDGIGKPFQKYLNYLKGEHLKHCVPSTVSSGLSKLPLKNVYTDGRINEDQPTKRKLPSGETLNGREAYKKLLRYYTTLDWPVEEINKKGYSVLHKFFPELLSVIQQISGEDANTTKGSSNFKTIITSQDKYFNEGPFPKNETGEEAEMKCRNEESAKKNCPKRWEAMQSWFNYAKQLMSHIQPMITPFFEHTGPERTTPSCPVKLVPDFNPSAGVQSYLESDEDCTEPAKYFIPFFNDNSGPRYEEVSTNGHESRPGHHLQSQGYLENFVDPCDDAGAWLENIVSLYPAFTEGWALYSENPLLAKDVDIYKDDPLGKYGMLKWQIWRALRVITDIGLHYKNMSRDEAFEMFNKYTWDDSDITKKEITRYQGTPAQATAYVIGQQAIINLRNELERKLGDNFSLKSFHFHLLSQGDTPLTFQEEYMKKYADCMLDKSNDKNCDSMLSYERYHAKCTQIDDFREKRTDRQVFALFKKKMYK